MRGKGGRVKVVVGRVRVYEAFVRVWEEIFMEGWKIEVMGRR